MNYRTTRIYSRSMELIDFTVATIKTLPPGLGFMADQLRRAASSIPLNYLEGCGRTGSAERRRFFHIAIGSAMEVSATIEVIHRFDGLDSERAEHGTMLCDHVVHMLRRFR